MPGRQRVADQAERADRARRAYELALRQNSTRVIADQMKAEGYRNVSTSTVGKLIREYAETIVTPLARDHVKMQLDRLEESRARLLSLLEKTPAPVTSGKDGLPVIDPITHEVVRDYTLYLQVEDRLHRIEAQIAKLRGLDAAVEHHVTVQTEADRALSDLVGEMNARTDTTANA